MESRVPHVRHSLHGSMYNALCPCPMLQQNRCMAMAPSLLRQRFNILEWGGALPVS
jgi:hypothetical protein